MSSAPPRRPGDSGRLQPPAALVHSAWRGFFERDVLVDPRLRLFGIVPIAAFVLHFVNKQYVINPPRGIEVLWMCHVSALLMGVSMLSSWAVGMRIAAAWSIVGVPNFLAGVLASPVPLSRLSWFTHLLLPLLGIICVSQTRMDHRKPRHYIVAAYVFWLALQMLSRLATDRIWNINLVFDVWAPFAAWGFNYALFFLLLHAIILLCLSAVFVLFFRFFPATDGDPLVTSERTPIAPGLRRGLR